MYLRDYNRRLLSNDNVAPAGWRFDPTDWWVEEHGLTLYDVTHLPCRSAAYRGGTCEPRNANLNDFPVRPGAEMPKIDGCNKQDYAVLFVLGEEL